VRPSSYAEFAYTAQGVADIRRLERKIVKAVGAEVATEYEPRKWRLAWQRNCLRPIEWLWIGRSTYLSGKRDKRPLIVAEYLPCRKCEGCLAVRSRMWAGRAVAEYDRAAVTWMGTFTMSPEQHSLLDLRIAERTGNRSLTQVELLRERTSLFGQEVTAWLKRIRSGAFERTGRTGSMRYLLVAEVHDSEKTNEWMRGRPHFHMLLHEAFAGALVSPEEIRDVSKDGIRRITVADDAMIRKAWTFGYTKFERCIDSRSAYYLCKYLSKAMMWRVRPSLHYGRETVSTPAEAGERARASERESTSPPKDETFLSLRTEGEVS